MTKDNYKIEIEINCLSDDEVLFENSLDEAVRLIKEGYYSGSDSNDDEDYNFTLTKNK